MAMPLQVGRIQQMRPGNPFLQCELVEERNPHETALEAPLFDFASTNYEMGTRLIYIPANRAFAWHVHPNAHHFIYVIEGTGLIEYDHIVQTLQPEEILLDWT